MLLTTIIANLLATGSAVLLARRGPNRRLRLLTLVVGLMSLSRTVGYVHPESGLSNPAMALIQELWIAALALASVYLLAGEMRDRKATDQKLRLMEHFSTPAGITAMRVPATGRIRNPPEDQAAATL